ncbi:tRNA lysidine(34) synthetase TilS [uncultured Tenacibaculum sp.]|uniref:tRNA lysidine(34) synthetase TilS n=1 Tax=uncultured Tenacibaculum sp. TaxID=174713 RepID=UPI002620BECE|nr:tRNA lysidine(34) synthetase TilS [uncultured Tenacibaculum sp.]
MLHHFKSHIKTNFSFLEEKPFLIAVSGGIDSVVLVHLFHSLGLNFSIAHCNFKLRSTASDLDEKFVKTLGEQLKIKVFVKQFDTSQYATSNNLSIQLAARELRYNWFHSLLESEQLDYILTAHHADDNLETFLINLTRSSGLDGLIGIPKKQGNLVRPLLPFSREEIENYAKERGINWREDESNAELKYLRNRIRHKIIPELKDIAPNILKSFEKVSQNLSESKVIIDDRIEEISKKLLEKDENLIKINVEKVLKLSNPKAYLFQLLKNYNFSEWDNVNDLLNSQSGKLVSSKTHEILRDRDYLLISEKNKDKVEEIRIEVGLGTTKIDENTEIKIEKYNKNQLLDKKSILVNKNLVTFPMIIRKWEVGDFFYPSGMKGKKKVSKFFKDEKFSKFQKEKTWLLCTKENKIIWIVNKRQDRRFTASTSTKDVLKISI